MQECQPNKTEKDFFQSALLAQSNTLKYPKLTLRLFAVIFCNLHSSQNTLLDMPNYDILIHNLLLVIRTILLI